VSDANALIDAIEHFLKGLNLLDRPPRSLAAVMVLRWLPPASTASASSNPGEYQRGALEILAAHGSEMIDVESTHLAAAFSGAVRVIRCALDVRSQAVHDGCPLSIGVHLGECRHEGGTWQGGAPALAHKIAALAANNEIVVSREVKDLMTGSGIPFVDLPEQRARGIPGIELFLVEPQVNARISVHPAAVPVTSSTLTTPQRTILELVAQGMSNKEIARLLHRSEHTIHRHMANIFDRLGVSTRAAAVAKGGMAGVGKNGPNG
jgi:DNA-binding CsgD family transcriptional regulator